MATRYEPEPDYIPGLVVALEPSDDLGERCKVGTPCEVHRHDNPNARPCGAPATVQFMLGSGDGDIECEHHALEALRMVFAEQLPDVMAAVEEWFTGDRARGMVVGHGEFDDLGGIFDGLDFGPVRPLGDR